MLFRSYEKENNLWMNRSDDQAFVDEVVANGEDMEIVGIMRPNPEAVATGETGSIGYTSLLKEHIMQAVNGSEIVEEQINNPEINVFTGLEFPENTNEEFDFAALSDEERAYMATLSEVELAELLNTYQDNFNATYESNLATLAAVDEEKPSDRKSVV